MNIFIPIVIVQKFINTNLDETSRRIAFQADKKKSIIPMRFNIFHAKNVDVIININ